MMTLMKNSIDGLCRIFGWHDESDGVNRGPIGRIGGNVGTLGY